MSYTKDQNDALVALALKLSALNIRGTLSHIEAGPIVTTYYFNLGADIPIARVLKAEEDLALAVGAPSVLITRKGAQIAIAIPNKTKETVSFDKSLHNLFVCNSRLPIMLGNNTRGLDCAIDLAESPHILIAGSTGAGKSVL